MISNDVGSDIIRGTPGGRQLPAGSYLSTPLWSYAARALAHGWYGIPSFGSTRYGCAPMLDTRGARGEGFRTHTPFPGAVLPRFGVPSGRRGASGRPCARRDGPISPDTSRAATATRALFRIT